MASDEEDELMQAVAAKQDESVTRCPCGNNEDQEGFMIQCEGCDVWQHGECIGITAHTVPEEYKCEVCRPDDPVHVRRRVLMESMGRKRSRTETAPPAEKKPRRKRPRKPDDVLPVPEEASAATAAAAGLDIDTRNMSRDDRKMLRYIKEIEAMERHNSKQEAPGDGQPGTGGPSSSGPAPEEDEEEVAPYGYVVRGGRRVPLPAETDEARRRAPFVALTPMYYGYSRWILREHNAEARARVRHERAEGHPERLGVAAELEAPLLPFAKRVALATAPGAGSSATARYFDSPGDVPAPAGASPSSSSAAASDPGSSTASPASVASAASAAPAPAPAAAPPRKVPRRKGGTGGKGKGKQSARRGWASTALGAAKSSFPLAAGGPNGPGGAGQARVAGTRR